MIDKLRASKDHFVGGVRYPLAADAVLIPPVQCHVQVGDMVTFTNGYGIAFHDQIVTGFSPTVEGGRFVYFDNAAWWFPVKPSRMTKQTHRMTEGSFGSEVGHVPAVEATINL